MRRVRLKRRDAGRHRHRFWPALSTAVALAACDPALLNRSESMNPSSVTERGSDIARSFDQAVLVLPGAEEEPLVIGTAADPAVAARLQQIAASRPLPFVLYMHGCTGLENLAPLKALAREGFAVLAPDSFARRYRPLQCRPSQRQGGENVFVFDFRLTEISYAIHRLARAGWIDNRYLYLVGVSEGAVAVALYRGDVFRARVISQWTCHGNPYVRGVAGPDDLPVLAIVSAQDPWYRREMGAIQGDCGDFIAGRRRSRSIVLTDVAGHDVMNDARVQEMIAEFLRGEMQAAGGR